MSAATVTLATVVLALTPQAPAPDTGPLEPLVLAVTFDDRVSRQPVGPWGATAWTPMFPRVAGWRPPAGQPAVAAVRYGVERTPSGFRYEVSVLLGPEHQREEQVAAGTLRVDEPVTIDGLLTYGVRPIALALRPLAPAAVHQPAVVNRSAGLNVSNVEIVTEPAPRYRVTIENLTDRDALLVGVESRRDGKRANSGIQGHEEGEPIVKARGTHSFDWPFATGPQPRDGGEAWAPLPVDEIILTGVAWADGSSEGDAALASGLRVRDLARRLQLDRLLPVLRTAAASTAPIPDTLARLTGGIEALVIDADPVAEAARAAAGGARHAEDVDRMVRMALQRVKTRARAAVASIQSAYATSGNSVAARRDLAVVLERFSAWRARLDR
jgi:hypothetical protein